jgi:tetratricopeptide (TPR) repeat protein
MAEDKRLQGQQLQDRLAKLAQDWAGRKVNLKQIIGLSPEELYAVANQGYTLFLQGKTEPARVVFEGLAAIDPRNAYYHRALGAIYWRLKEPQKAIKQFTYAIQAASREISSYINRAEVYVAQRQFKLARADLMYALENARSTDDALIRKAQAILRMIQ